MRSVKIQGGKVRTEFLSRYDCEHGSRDAGKQESRKAKRCYCDISIEHGSKEAII